MTLQGENTGNPIPPKPTPKKVERKSLWEKLFTVQEKVKAIEKRNTNPFFKSKYFDINDILQEIKPILVSEGLILLQPITTSNSGDGLVNILLTQIADKDTGESVTSQMILNKENDPQKFGSQITYFRRYALQSLLALQAEDDDANNASGKVNNSTTKMKLTKQLKEHVFKAIEEGRVENVKTKLLNYEISPKDLLEINEAIELYEKRKTV